MDNKKTECLCGGLYSYKNKAKHMRTSKHTNFINSQNQVEILYESIMKLSEEDKLLLFAKLNIDKTPETPEPPEPKTPEESKFKEGIKKLTDAYEGDFVEVLINSSDDQFDELQTEIFVIENLALDILPDDVEVVVYDFFQYLQQVGELRVCSKPLPGVIGFSKKQRQKEFEYGDIVKHLAVHCPGKTMKNQIDYLSKRKNIKELISAVPNEENRREFVKGSIANFINEGQDKIITCKETLQETEEAIEQLLLKYPFFKNYPTYLT
jgi:hypothetical protein